MSVNAGQPHSQFARVGQDVATDVKKGGIDDDTLDADAPSDQRGAEFARAVPPTVPNQ